MATYVTDPQYSSVNLALSRLEKIILDTLDFNKVIQKVVDSMLFELDFLNLGYRIMVLSLIDEEKGVLKRVSISQTKEAQKATGGLPMNFTDVEIPMTATENICIKTMLEKKSMHTYQWNDILTPPLTKEEAIDLQKKVGIKTSMVYPLIVNEKPIGMMIFSMVKDISEISDSENMLLNRFTDLVALSVQNAKLYSSVEETKNKLAIANVRLKELDKLKDEFVSVASHELRTPLTAIRSYLWMALKGKGGALTEKQQYYLDRSYNSTIRLINLVNDMLNTSRIESGRMKFVMKKGSVQELITNVVEEVTPRANELGLHIVFEKCKNEEYAVMDTDKIHEVLINLIGNSLKFTPKGGTITLSCLEKDGYISIQVADSGSGIESDDIPRLFQKFGMIEGSYATNQLASQGTGLGLYICKSMIEKHQGTIGAASPGKNKGSVFTFTLLVYSPEKEKEFNQAEVDTGLDIIHSEFK